MFKVNGKDQTLIFLDARSLLQTKKEIPLWIIEDFRKVKIPKTRKTINYILGFGYVLVTVSFLWLITKMNVPAWLFLTTYATGVTLITLKTIDDKKILKVDGEEGIEHIIITTEWGDYIIDCGGECGKLAAFLETYLKKE